jgi:DNA-binding SARP family transcriptional activator
MPIAPIIRTVTCTPAARELHAQCTDPPQTAMNAQISHFSGLDTQTTRRLPSASGSLQRATGALVIELKVLGEFEATCNGSIIPLQPMQKIVILILLCADGLIARDRIVRLIWDHPSAGSVKTLHTHLSRIGKGVEAVGGQPDDFVVTVPLGSRQFGYRLARGLDIDAVRFQRQVVAGCEAYRQGRIEDADAGLSAALRLRERGRPAVEVAGRPFALGYVHDLEETYKNALIAHFKCGISLGRHREAVGAVRRLTRRWPGEGELWELLVHALYRSDRMADASEACREAIAAIRAEGADDRSFSELQRNVLRGALPKRGSLVVPVPVA